MKEQIRQYSLPGFELGDYIQESIDFLRQNEPPEGYFVGFSGGKDSITTLELCRMAGVKHAAYYSCTRIDPPELIRFIKANYPQIRWLFPKESFWELIQKKMPPLRTKRWCCDYLKKSPSRNISLSMRVMGIRAEESVMRAKRPRIDKYNAKQWLIKPIFRWPEWAVWDFIDAYKLSYPSLYDEGFSRIGCEVCPFIFGTSPAQIANRERSMRRWPGLWKVFEHAVKRWVQKTIDTGLRPGQKIRTADEFWKVYINGGCLKVEQDKGLASLME